MSSRKQVLVAITARPSYSRIRTALEALRDTDACDLSVVCSGSALLDRYGRVVDLIRDDGFDVVDELFTFVEGDEPVNMALTTSNTVAHTAAMIRRRRPDLVVTIADRYETLGTSIAAAYLNTPLVHVQGGEITGNIDEKVRHSITKLADLHLVATRHAGERLVRMGEHPDTIKVTGCPSIDLAREADNLPLSDVADVLSRTAAGHPMSLEDDYIVVMQHPETDTHARSFDQMSMVLEEVEKIGLPVVLFWPNVDAGSDGTSKAIRIFRETGKGQKFAYLKNLEGHQFLRLLQDARVLVGNSSVGIRESAFLGIPVVNIGDRQQGRERGANVRDAGWSASAIGTAIREQIAHGHYRRNDLYGDGHSGTAIAREILAFAGGSSKRFYDG